MNCYLSYLWILIAASLTAIRASLDVYSIESVGNHLDVHAFIWFLDDPIDLIDEDVIFQRVPVLFDQTALNAWVNLDEDYFVHWQSHDPDVVVAVDVVTDVIARLDRQLKAHLRFVVSGVGFGRSWQVEVYDLDEVMVLYYEVASSICSLVASLDDLHYFFDDFSINFILILNHVPFLRSSDLKDMISSLNDSSFDFVIVLLLKVVEPFMPVWCFLESILIIRQGFELIFFE